MTLSHRYGFRMKPINRGVKIASRRRMRVWLKLCEPMVAQYMNSYFSEVLQFPTKTTTGPINSGQLEVPE